LRAAAEEVSKRLDDDAIVGVLFILNGEIQTLELFDTPSLFKKAHRPILESFLAEASASVEKDAKPLDKAAYTGFIAECLSAPVPKSEGYNAMDGERYQGRGYSSKAGAVPAHSSFAPK
jgi:hypothetical protein